MITRIRNAADARPLEGADAGLEACASACSTCCRPKATSAATAAVEKPSGFAAVRDRAEVLRRRAGDRRDRPRLQAGPPRLFVDRAICSRSRTASASRSCRRPRASCPTPPPATPTSAAKSSAASTRQGGVRCRASARSRSPIPAGVTVTLDGPEGHREGPQGRALLDRGRRDRGQRRTTAGSA